MPRWTKCRSVGVRYREHKTRKHGVRPDRYFSIRYKLGGKDREEALGWSSQGWTEQKAAEHLADIKKAHRTGEGAKSLAEKRELAEKQQAVKQAEEAQRLAEEERRINFNHAAGLYLEWAKGNKKDWEHDSSRLSLHILPVIGDVMLENLEAVHVEGLKSKLQEKGMAPATLKHCLQVVRAVFNFCIRMGIYDGANPTKSVRFPKLDNKRDNFFTPEQVEQLLAVLWEKDIDAHDITTLSVYAGLRFSECARLRWEAVDLENGILHIRDAKSGESRKAFITPVLQEMLERRQGGTTSPLVFPNSKGGIYKDIGDNFTKAINSLGFNAGVEDRRQRLTFHSCRHTFGSWLAQQGTPILTIKELMGHKTLEMTMRYAHLSPDSKREAVEQLARRAKAGARGKVVPFRKTAGA